jgi:DNA gyrase subunit B
VPAKPSYSADDLTHLEGLEAVRKRPGMYIGGTGSPGLMHCIWEILDNSVDEALAGFCTRVEVTLHPDGSVEVSDDGRGIPVDVNRKTGKSGVLMAIGSLHSGGKFGGSGYKSAGGLHGVGSSVVSALSSRFDVTVFRDGVKHQLSFQRGKPGKFTGAGPDSGFSAVKDLWTAGKAPRGHTGTTIRFWPDPAIFHPDAVISPDEVFTRSRQAAFLVAGLAICVRDLTNPKEPKEETFSFKGGVRDMVEHLSSGTPVCDTVHFTGTGRFIETVPVLDDKGHMTSREVEREVQVDVALRYDAGYDTDVKSFVNVVATPKGGTHLKGFERGLVAAVRKGYDGTRLMKANEDPVTLDDCQEGLTAVISVGFPEPQFEGQTKEILGTPAITKIVQDVVSSGVSAWMNGRKKSQARSVLEKIANAARTRIASRSQREAARRKTAIESASMPSKLVDCRAIGVSRSELFIVEGDSALGSARAGRNSEYQALLPIRGKILNVQKASLAQMLANTECASIIQVIGAGSGRTFDLETMRYQRIILMADADVDGAHIRVLLLTLFHRYMRPIIEAGRLYAAVPPLYKIETTGRNKETHYAYSSAEMAAITARLSKEKKQVKTPVARFKGLGEMNADELWETTMDPQARTVRQISIADAQVAEHSLTLLMGDDVAPRRDWLVANADRVDRTALDA